MTALFSFLIGFLAGVLIHAIGTRAGKRDDRAAVTRRHLAELLRSQRIDRSVYDAVMDALRPTAPSVVEPALPVPPPAPPVNEVVTAELVSTPTAVRDPSLTPASPPNASTSADTTGPAMPPVAPASKTTEREEKPVVPSNVPVQERARAYSERRSSSDNAQEREAKAPDPAEPQTAWSVWFAAFMEEKNIRWGELVGGLLIVSCSVALVVSFWESIAEEPLLKFGVLNGVTAALFGVGLHAARHWKLPTTSQGILITASLLVPLNFLAIAAFSDSSSTPTLTGVVGESVSVLLFSTLVYFGARVISTRWSIPLTAGVIVPSVCQLAIRRHVDETSAIWLLYALSLMCMSAMASTCVFVIQSLKKRSRVPERRANELLKHVGIVAFSMFVSLGLLLAKSERVGEVLQQLSPLSIVIASPLFLCGTVLWKRPGASNEGLRLAGSSLAVAAVFVFLAGCIAAWPQPGLMVALAIVGVACLTWIAIDLQIPDAHLVAAVFWLPAVVLVGNVIVGNLAWTGETPRAVIEQSASALTGRILTGLAYVGMALSAALAYLRRAEVAVRYAAVCVGSAVVGLLLVGFHGFGRAGDPEFLTLILGLHTAAALVAAFSLRNRVAMSVGAGLLLATLFQGLQYGPVDLPLNRPWLVALLVHASAMAVVAVIIQMQLRAAGSTLSRTAWSWSLGSAGLVVISLIIIVGPNLTGTTTDPLTLYLVWLAIIWLVLSILDESSDLFRMFQVTLALAVVAGVDRVFHQQAWYQVPRFGWLHPTVLLCQGIALSLYSLCWIGVRTALQENWLPNPGSSRWREQLADWLAPTSLSVDRSVGIVSLCILVFLSIYGVVPGIAQELTPISGLERVVPDVASYELWEIPHAPAHGILAWILVVVVFLTQSIAFLEAPRRWNLTAVAMAVSTVPLLIASNWSATVSVASATRWACSIFFMLGSVLIWVRRPILSKLREAGWWKSPRRRDLQWFSFALLLIFSSAPLLLMAMFVALAAVSLQPPATDQVSWLVWLAALCLATLMGLVATSALPDEKRVSWRTASGSLAVLGSMPLFAMTLFVIGQALASHPIVGPDGESFFAKVGLSISYAVPLVLISVALVGHSINLRAASVALAAGLLLCLSGTAAYLLAMKGVDLTQLREWLRLGQLNSIIATVYSLGWIAVLKGPMKLEPAEAGLHWLKTQVGIGVGFIAIPVAALTIHLGLRPSSSVAIHEVAGVWGWTALALAIAASLSYFLYARRSWPKQATLVAVAGVCAMVALQSQVLDVGASWQSFHVLQLMTVVVGGMLIGIDRYRARSAEEDDPGPVISVCLLAVMGWLSLLGLRGIWGDPIWTSFLAGTYALFVSGACAFHFRAGSGRTQAQSD